MAKLISLNVEGRKHHELIIPFLNKERADIICLQEASKELEQLLIERDYHTTFSQMLINSDSNDDFAQGILIASKSSLASKITTYHKDDVRISPEQKNSRTFSYILIETNINGETFNIATTHLMDTADGREDDFQIAGVKELLNHLDKERPHIICGDFNMPRGYNSLYGKFTSRYKDTVPVDYSSSLDKNIHKLGQVKLDQPIFEKYMVDYIFTQSPYRAENVHLVFGISDHAAVIADIYVN